MDRILCFNRSINNYTNTRTMCSISLVYDQQKTFQINKENLVLQQKVRSNAYLINGVPIMNFHVILNYESYEVN